MCITNSRTRLDEGLRTRLLYVENSHEKPGYYERVCLKEMEALDWEHAAFCPAPPATGGPVW